MAVLEQLDMSGVLNKFIRLTVCSENGVRGLRRVGTPDACRSGNGQHVVLERTAFSDEKVVVAILFVYVRALGVHLRRSHPQVLSLRQPFSGLEIDLVLLDS